MLNSNSKRRTYLVEFKCSLNKYIFQISTQLRPSWREFNVYKRISNMDNYIVIKFIQRMLTNINSKNAH